MNLEHTLPAEFGFNYALDDDGAMHFHIEQTKQKYIDIIDHKAEFNSFENLIVLHNIANLLSNTFSINPNDDPGRAAVYRTVCFFNQVTDIASCGNDFDFDFGDYLDELGLVEDVTKKINADAQEYLEIRPEVDAFIGYYAPELDPTRGRWIHLVETVGAIMFKIAERGIARAQIEAEIDQTDLGN